VKFWLAPDIENRIQAGEIFAHFESRVTRITEDGLEIQSPDGLRWLEIDYVLALTGYGPDVEILRRAGAEIDPSRRKVTVNPETLETTVPGLFLAGVLIAGNMSGDIFIENSRDHGRKILRALASR
jgi:thioredoxin reductase (NADPH)